MDLPCRELCKLENRNRVYVPRTQGEVPYKEYPLKDEGERRCGIENLKTRKLREYLRAA